jgi:putative transposase
VLLVVIGVRADGTKELIALDDGHRESTESSLDLLRGCKRRGMAAPVLAVGDGALGFWSAVREVFPETREQRCWWPQDRQRAQRAAQVRHPGAKKALAEIWNAEDKDHAQAAANVFAADYGTKWPKAAAKITDELDVLLAFYDYPAEHWIHLRTTNPIESTFATVRLRQRVTKGPRLPRRRCRDGVQAHRISTDPVAGRQRTPPRRAGSCRRGIQERQAHRTTRRIRGW